MPYVPGGSSSGGTTKVPVPTFTGPKPKGDKPRDPTREVIRGLARYIVANRGKYDQEKLGGYLKGLKPEEVKIAANKANIPRKQVRNLVEISKVMNKENGGSIQDIATKPASGLMWALKQSSRPGQAVTSAVAEWSRQAESGKGTQIGPINIRLGVDDWGKIGKAFVEGGELKRGDTPTSIAREAGVQRQKQGLSTKSFGFVPGTDLTKGQALPGGAAGRIGYDIGGGIALDPLTYVSFGVGGAGRRALVQAGRVLGAERAVQIAEGGAKILSASEKARLGKDIVQRLGRARGGLVIRRPQPIEALRGGKILTPGRSVIPFKGTAAQRVGRAGMEALGSTKIGTAATSVKNLLEDSFVPRSQLKRAEEAGRVPMGTADKVDNLRAAWQAGKRADRDIRILHLIGKNNGLSRNQLTDIAFALDEGNPSALTGNALNAYNEYDAYRRGFSQELRDAGIIDTAENVTQKRFDAVYNDYASRYERANRQAEKLRLRADRQAGVTSEAAQKRAAAELKDLTAAEANTNARLAARQQAQQDVMLATQQRQYNRAVQMAHAGAKRANRVAQSAVQRTERAYNLVVRAIASGQIAEARAAAKTAFDEAGRLQRGLKAVEAQIATLRKQRAALGVVGEAGQRRAILDERIRNLIEERNATRNVVGDAAQKASDAKQKLDRLIATHGTPGVAKDLRGLSPEELIARREQLYNDYGIAVGEADTAAASLRDAEQRLGTIQDVTRTPVPRMPGAVQPGISKSAARAREVLSKEEMRRRIFERAATQAEGRLARLQQRIGEKIATTKVGIEDEFYYPHTPRIVDPQQKVVNDETRRILMGGGQPSVVEGPPGFAKRRTGGTLREKIAAGDSVETNPGAAFGVHAIEGRKAIANREYVNGMLELTDNEGLPLLRSGDDFNQSLLQTPQAQAAGITSIDQITPDFRSSMIENNGLAEITIPGMGSYVTDTALMPMLKKVQKLSMPNEMGRLMRGYDKWMSLWKSYATVPFPFGTGFSMRNGAGNVMQNWLADIPVGDPAYFQAAKLQRDVYKGMMEAGDPFLYISDKWRDLIEEARKRDILGSNFVNEDLPRDQLAQFYSFGQKVRSKINPLSSEFPLVKYGRAMNGMIENNARLAHFIAKVREYGNFEDAAASVRKYLFDYGDVTEVEQQVMKRLIPFYTFMRKNTPLWVGAFFKQPQKFSRMEMWRRAIADSMGNPDMGVVPFYLEQAGAFPSPFRLDKSPTMVAPDLPPVGASDVITPLMQLAGMVKSPEGLPGALSAMYNQFGGGPIGAAKTGLEIAQGKELFSGRPFYPGERVEAPYYAYGAYPLLENRVVNDQKQKAIPRTLQYALEQNLPLLTKLNSLFPASPTGKERQTRRMLSTLTGLQLYPLGPETVRSEMFRRGQQVNNLLEEMRSLGKDVPENLRRKKSSSTSSKIPVPKF